MGNFDPEGAIPLTQVLSRNSTRGARKQGEGVLNGRDMSSQPKFVAEADEEEENFTFHHGRRKVRKEHGGPIRRGTDGEEIAVTGLGKVYKKITGFSVLVRYMMYVVPVGSVLAAPVAIYAVVNPNARFLNTGIKVYLFWLWILIIWLSMWLSKLVSKAIPFIFMFVCGVVSSGTKKYATILRAVEIPLSLVGWTNANFLSFRILTTPALNPSAEAPKGWISTTLKVLAPMCIGSLLFLAEKMMIQLVSINYHKRSFHGKIKDSKRNIHLLGLLYDASRQLFPVYCPEFIEEDYLISDSLEALLAKNVKRDGSNTPMRIIGNIGRAGDKFTSVFGNIASEITGKQVFNPLSSHSVILQALEKQKSSEALAKRLWMSFVVEGKESLLAEDIEEVLGNQRKEEAGEIFRALDNDENGDISLEEMIMKVVEIGRERKAITASMRDVGQAIGVLDSVLVTIVSVIILFVFVAFQNTSFITTLATAGTTLLSLSFVFAATTQEFLGSCIFLFVKHPYDVGDRVDIDHVFLVVEQISLLYTIFKRIDTMKMVQVPNIVLNNLWIENVTRSKAMKEQLDMFISFETSLEDIELLRAEMEAFVRAPENARDFQPDIVLEATGIGSMDKLQLKVEIKHKSNWANETVRAARRSKFMCALVVALRKVPIYAPGEGYEPLGTHNNPGYTVSVPDSWAANAREEASKAKEALRMVPNAEDAGSTGAAWTSGREEKEPNLGPHSTKEDLEREQKRTSDISVLKQGLLKRASTRGRRRPGDHVPAPPAFLGVNVTAPSPKNSNSPSRRSVSDEEADLEHIYGSPMYQRGYGAQSQSQSQNPYISQVQPGTRQVTPEEPGLTGPRSSPQPERTLSLGFKNSRSG
ncbi:hypothetical protein LZ554_003553 [Drepanopeziza brunnea f. sp. 'monogermtubi']|nr:hypothetical protein LZ554_003553 [Drepanopeziza brunnea f. sp. 'monogermtubi']